METVKKITRATVKSFIKNSFEKLYIKNKWTFSGMTDGTEYLNDGFKKATEGARSNDLGVAGAWFVGQSNDSFTAWESETMKGIEVYNSCGCFILAIQK